MHAFRPRRAFLRRFEFICLNSVLSSHQREPTLRVQRPDYRLLEGREPAPHHRRLLHKVHLPFRGTGGHGRAYRLALQHQAAARHVPLTVKTRKRNETQKTHEQKENTKLRTTLLCRSGGAVWKTTPVRVVSASPVTRLTWRFRWFAHGLASPFCPAHVEGSTGAISFVFFQEKLTPPCVECTSRRLMRVAVEVVCGTQ